MRFLTFILLFFTALTASCSDDPLPQLSSSDRIITREMFNDMRSVLYGDLVCRDASGNPSDGSCSLGTSSYGMENLYFTNATNEVRLNENSGALDVVVSGGVVGTFSSTGFKNTVNYEQSSSSGTFSTTSSSYTDVTNLSVSITTKGNPVVAMLIADGDTTLNNNCVLECASSASGNGCNYQITSSGGTGNISGQVQLGSNLGGTGATSSSTTVPGSALQLFFPALSAGAHTIKVQAYTNSSEARVEYCKLVAYEL